MKKNPGQWLKKVYLRSGPGDYEVQLLVKTDLKEQSFLIYDTIKVQSQFSWDPNVLPSHYAESDSPVIINLAKAITKNKKTNTDKAKALYEWVKQNISYDYMTLEKFSKGLSYIDVHGQDVSALYTLQNRIDVCVGYASLYAALLRSINIPTRIIFGDTPQGEHAWNEVFIDNKWLLTDVTWDSPNGNEYFNPTAEFFEKTHHTRKPTLY